MYFPSQIEYFIFYRRKDDAGNWFSHISLRRWTPGKITLCSSACITKNSIESRYYDVLITDSSGLALCELRNLIVKKFIWAAPITVERRFDLGFQPVAMNADIPTLPSSFPERPESHLLYEALDSLAVTMIFKSLNRDLVIGQGVRTGVIVATRINLRVGIPPQISELCTSGA
jgi:hypothetical protein